MHPLHELTLDELRRRTSMKWREHPDDVLPMFVAEMDAPLAEPVAKALHDAVGRGDTGYPSPQPLYAEAWAELSADRWGVEVDIARTADVADVMTGIATAIALVSSPGDPVVVNPPVYPPFFEAVRQCERSLVEAPLGSDGRLDPQELGETFERAAFGGRAVTYLLCSPHNPTGAVHTREELEAVARLAGEHRVRVVVDEIHSPLAPRDFVPYLDVAGSADAYAVVSASKAWNLAGIKAALLIGGVATSDELAGMSWLVSHGPSHLGTIAHVAAMREGRDWLDAVVADLVDNRAQVARFLATELPDVRAHLGPGTYLGWLDLRPLGLGDDPAATLLQRGRVALQPGLPFGHGEGHVRLNYATTPQVLADGLERIARGVGHG
ncbi:MalY/PatB family protein [Aeromicrobium sp. CTD01-1L150]|uniref:MalY/PatB family protein n=1 Tax=Aeromicrobium sp. CTD01-1L150 TaxID=3341830 RepID=UPI0035C13EF6